MRSSIAILSAVGKILFRYCFWISSWGAERKGEKFRSINNSSFCCCGKVGSPWQMQPVVKWAMKYSRGLHFFTDFFPLLWPKKFCRERKRMDGMTYNSRATQIPHKNKSFCKIGAKKSLQLMWLSLLSKNFAVVRRKQKKS